MPNYKSYDFSTAQVLVKSYAGLKDEVDALKKDKKSARANKAKVKKLEVDLKRKVQTLDTHLSKQMGLVRKEFTKHALYVEKMLTTAEISLKTAKTDLKAFKKDLDFKKFKAVTSVQARMKALAVAGEKDQDEFGKSWFALRSSPPQKAPKEGLKTFVNLRAGMMGDQKAVIAKIARLGNIAKEATIIANYARAEFTKKDDSQDLGAVLEDWQELVKRFNDAMTHYKTGFATIAHKATSRTKLFEGNAKKKKGLEEIDLTTMKSGIDEYVATIKRMKADQKTMGKELKQLKSFLSPSAKKDAKIKKQIVEATQLLQQAGPHITSVQDALKKMVPLFQTCVKRVRGKKG